VRVEQVNDAPAEPPAERPRFADLAPRFASDRLASPEGLETAPYGKGSRVAVSGQPGAGATTFLRTVAALLRDRHPEVELTVVLAGVRPEEVAEWGGDAAGAIAGGGADRPVDEQAQAAEMAVHRAKRAVESGRDAALVIDSLDALPPAAARRAFAAARNAEGGGTLTVFAAVGMAQDALRIATTRIFLQPAAPGEPPALAPGSGTTRAELLG
jgi:transcription termination factor Rho